MTPDYNQAATFIQALTGSVDAPMEWRGIPDDKTAVDQDVYNKRGTLAQMWAELQAWNLGGRGVFAMINPSNGLGREAQNITGVRANFIDLDKGDVAGNYAKAVSFACLPHIVVNSSPGKYHLYWKTAPYTDLVKFSEIQRKLIANFGSDKTINDAPRVMRIPGFIHAKADAGRVAEPFMSTVHAGPAWDAAPTTIEALSAALGHVTAVAGGGIAENELGDPKLAAPSFEMACRALEAIDPNGLEYDQWRDIAFSFKQAIWSHTTPMVAKMMFDAWTAKSAKNERNETEKLWRSIKNPRSGWPGLLKRSGLLAHNMFGNGPGVMPVQPQQQQGLPVPVAPLMNGVAPVVPVQQFGVFLDPGEQAKYFAGCFLIMKDEKILTPSGRFMGPGKFNAAYGGKQFMIKSDGNGSTTDEAWKAATRGQLYQVPKVDHIRFLPSQPTGALIVDELGRSGVNTYIPATIETIDSGKGGLLASPFVNHLRKILPTEHDVLILLNFFARIAQSPGVKIPWAPVIQSAEGVGKNVIKFCMSHIMGSVYTYYPKASELAETGGKFNAWMRARLFILCDEVKTDDKRNLIEALKDMVSEEKIQIQGKGVDQDIEDNFANWIFFTNWEDAIPIDRKSRRWAIFYSRLQTEDDILAAGMDAAYFTDLYDWVKNRGGKQIVAHYLKTFSIDPALDPAINQRAPKTSSYQAALVASRTAPEAAIIEAVEAGRNGFKGGWISSAAVQLVFKELEMKISHPVVGRILKNMGYYKVGRAARTYIQENNVQPNLYNVDNNAQISNYGVDQGYGG